MKQVVIIYALLAFAAMPAASVAEDVTVLRRVEEGSFVRINGFVSDIPGHGELTLDYGGDVILVETDPIDQSYYTKDVTFNVEPGDRITVYGRIENDPYGDQKLIAYTVTLENGQVIRSPETADDFDAAGDDGVPINLISEDKSVVLSGTVERIIDNRRFILHDEQRRNITVAVRDTPEGIRLSDEIASLREGDKVIVSGYIREGEHADYEMRPYRINPL